MKMTNQIATSIICITVAGATLQNAKGAVVITIAEEGSNVVLVGSGSLNIEALTIVSNGGYTSAGVRPNEAWVTGGADVSLISLYQQVNGPTSIGLGSAYYAADTSVGQVFGVIGGTPGLPGTLVVPQDYVSGSALASNATFTGHSLASLGLAEGAYVWTWGSGATADSLTLNVIPEPSTTLLACLAMGSLLQKRNRNGRTSRG